MPKSYFKLNPLTKTVIAILLSIIVLIILLIKFPSFKQNLFDLIKTIRGN